MTLIGKLFAATALVSALAMPVFAQDVMIDLGRDVTLGIAGPGRTSGDATDGAVEGGTAVDPGEEAIAGDFTGKSVVSSDGVLIGHVVSAEGDMDGEVKVIVMIDGEGAGDTMGKSFSVIVAGDVSEEVTLGWTQAELMAAITAQM